MKSEDTAQTLVTLGFTGLEAEIYVALLQSSPATGYGVAQLIGKPLSNVYKALESLQHKGAILVDDGESRMCRAVPADELLNHLDRNFRKNKQRAANALKNLKSHSTDDRIYQLRSHEQVLERCRQMIQDCTEIIILDAFPDLLEELRTDLEKAAGRHLKVAVRNYSPAQIKGAEIFMDPLGEAIIRRWQGQWLCLVVDGSEYLMAFLSADGKRVYQAVWSSSPFISWVYYCALYGEIFFSKLRKEIEAGASNEQLQAVLKQYHLLWEAEPRGYRDLMHRFGSEPN